MNRVFERSGKVVDGRYHVTVIDNLRELRHTLAYILLNHRKHAKQCGQRPPRGIDKCSSGVWFTGWKNYSPPDPGRLREVARPGWKIAKGWRRNYRLIGLHEVPG